MGVRTSQAAISGVIRETWPMASPQTIGALVEAASIDQRPPGIIMSEAERPARVALVLHGTVVATWNAPDGRIAFAGLYGPGQIMGMATLSGGAMTVGIDALTPVTILVWRSDEFRAVASLDPAMTLDLLDRAIYAVQALNHLIKMRAFGSARSRLAAMLLRYEPFVFAESAPLVPRGQLGALAGVTPRMVSTILRGWAGRAIVRRVGRSGLELLDRQALEAEASPLAEIPTPDPGIAGAWSDPSIDA